MLFSTACNQISAEQDDRICLNPTPLAVGAADNIEKSWEQMGLTTDCIHRWSYRLARSTGPNREIAEAALGGCRDAVLREGNMMFQESTGREPNAAEERSMYNALKEGYSEVALFHVVQARAGNCDIPE